ncbi:MAG: hypothetical protein ACXVY8_01885 [Gaiellaceae bacterium]
MAENVPSEDLIEQMKQLRVGDLVLEMSMSLISLGFLRLEPEARDLDQARLAIDALRALVPLLSGRVAGELTRDLSQAVANLQLAYAKAVEEEAGGAHESSDEEAADGGEGEAEAAPPSQGSAG